MAPSFLEFRTPCSCSTHGCGRHHGLQMSAPVMGKHTVNAILTSVTAILCMLSCSTARVPLPEVTRMAGAFGDSYMASMPRRLQQDVAADPVAFLDVLGGEDTSRSSTWSLGPRTPWDFGCWRPQCTRRSACTHS